MPRINAGINRFEIAAKRKVVVGSRHSYRVLTSFRRVVSFPWVANLWFWLMVKPFYGGKFGKNVCFVVGFGGTISVTFWTLVLTPAPYATQEWDFSLSFLSLSWITAFHYRWQNEKTFGSVHLRWVEEYFRRSLSSFMARVFLSCWSVSSSSSGNQESRNHSINSWNWVSVTWKIFPENITASHLALWVIRKQSNWYHSRWLCQNNGLNLLEKPKFIHLMVRSNPS